MIKYIIIILLSILFFNLCLSNKEPFLDDLSSELKDESSKRKKLPSIQNTKINSLLSNMKI